jgi:hypothetical protein
VAKDHLARLVLNLVKEDIDLAAISGSYAGERGQPPFDPVMMTALLRGAASDYAPNFSRCGLRETPPRRHRG